MYIASTEHRRDLTLQVLPSQLVTKSTEAASSKSKATTKADKTELEEIQLEPSNVPAKKPNVHGVQNHQQDHAMDPGIDLSFVNHKAKGGVAVPFPIKLHDMLDKIEADGLSYAVSWQPHGRCFLVHKQKEFVAHVMPRYFKQTKMASFQRQLNLYGFNRLTAGPDKGGYYHKLFLRGRVALARDIHRTRVKGTVVRPPSDSKSEPNFYAMPLVGAKPDMAAAPFEAESPRASPCLLPPHVSHSDTTTLGIDTSQAQPRAYVLRGSHDYSHRVARAKQPSDLRQRRAESQDDVVIFEGLPFHYLDPIALPRRHRQATAEPRPRPQAQTKPSPPVAEEARQVVVHRSTSLIVSDSESEEDARDATLPSFSASTMDWDGPLSCPALQAYIRRSSFRSFPRDDRRATLMEPRSPKEDVEGFFQGFDMSLEV